MEVDDCTFVRTAVGPKSRWYDLFLYASTAIFTVEYLLRLWACVEDDRYPHPVLGRCVRPMLQRELSM